MPAKSLKWENHGKFLAVTGISCGEVEFASCYVEPVAVINKQWKTKVLFWAGYGIGERVKEKKCFDTAKEARIWAIKMANSLTSKQGGMQ